MRLRHFILSILLALPFFVVAQESTCRLGIRWQISTSKAWGYGRPVITQVEPYTNAQLVGLRSGDIIESIGGISTQGLNTAQISQLLNSPERTSRLTVHGVGASWRTLYLTPECYSPYGIGERELAEIFSLYSLEDALSLKMSYPFIYQHAPTVDLTNVRTFSLASSSTQTADIDRPINAGLRKLLISKGLTEQSNPDLIFATYYQLEPYPITGPENEDDALSWRYDPENHDFKPLPIVPSGHPAARYRLTFGVQALRPGSSQVIWQSEAIEHLSERIDIEEYAHYCLEPMLLGYPFVPNNGQPIFEAKTLRYIYTGLHLRRSDLRYIHEVEDDSPAYRAGLRSGDLIKSINGLPITSTSSDALLEQYYRWAERTHHLRSTAIPALGLTPHRIPAYYWRLDRYDDVANLLADPKQQSALSYLFAFRPYITPSGLTLLTFEIERAGQTYIVRLEPQRRDASTFTPLF